MKLYAVRLAHNQEAVGLFWVKTRGDLWDAIDAACDPGECEYRRVRGVASVIWPGPSTLQFGVDRLGNEAPHDFSGMEFDYSANDMLEDDNSQWFPLPCWPDRYAWFSEAKEP